MSPMRPSTHTPPGYLTAADRPVAGHLRVFGVTAVLSGWVLLSVPLVTDLPVEPFVLLTLAFGLVTPAVLLTRRDPDASMKALLRDCVRLPRRPGLLLLAPTVIPLLTWTGGLLAGAETRLSSGFLADVVVNVVTSVLIVNLWEEMAWAGFFQRRAMYRYGFVTGSLVTTALFVAVHLPLAFVDVGGVRDVLAGVAALVVSGIGLRLLVGAVDAWSARSILTVALLHASFNVAADFVDADHDWIRYTVTLLLGLLVLATPVARGATAGAR